VLRAHAAAGHMRLRNCALTAEVADQREDPAEIADGPAR
jgi:hypothetical protein